MNKKLISTLRPILAISLQTHAGFSLDSLASQVTEKVEQVKKVTTKTSKRGARETEVAVAENQAPESKSDGELSSELSEFQRHDVKKYCKINGVKNEICTEFLTFYYLNVHNHPEKVPNYYSSIENCLTRASFITPESKYLDGAVEAYEKSPADDKYAKECFRLADIVYGSTKWRDDSDKLKKKIEFYRTVSKKVEDEFPKKCDGVIATNTSDGNIKLAVDRRVKSNKIFYQGTSPDGYKLIVYCNGDVKSGSMTTYAETFEEGNKNTLSDQCVMQCASSRKSLACAKANGNFQDPGCNKVCKAQCK